MGTSKNFHFGRLEKSITRFWGFDMQRDPRGFILTQIPLIEKIFQSAKKHMIFGTSDQPTTTQSSIARDTSLNSELPVDSAAMSSSMRDWLLRFLYREILGAVGNVSLATRPNTVILRTDISLEIFRSLCVTRQVL